MPQFYPNFDLEYLENDRTNPRIFSRNMIEGLKIRIQAKKEKKLSSRNREKRPESEAVFGALPPKYGEIPGSKRVSMLGFTSDILPANNIPRFSTPSWRFLGVKFLL